MPNGHGSKLKIDENYILYKKKTHLDINIQY